MTPHEPQMTLDELTAGEIDAADVRVLAQVAAMYDTLDPVPGGLVERIQFAITLDALHAEVASLQRSADLAGVRSGATETQNITFTSSQLTTMITVTPQSGETVRIDGWVAPGDGVDVELRTTSASLRAVADADGRFVFEDVPRGMAQLVLRPPAESQMSTVVTPSIEL